MDIRYFTLKVEFNFLSYMYDAWGKYVISDGHILSNQTRAKLKFRQISLIAIKKS